MVHAFRPSILTVFFFNDTATTEIYTLSLHDALPIFRARGNVALGLGRQGRHPEAEAAYREALAIRPDHPDRKSTRLNSSHSSISYAVFCLKKKKTSRASYVLTRTTTRYTMSILHSSR